MRVRVTGGRGCCVSSISCCLQASCLESFLSESKFPPFLVELAEQLFVFPEEPCRAEASARFRDFAFLLKARARALKRESRL